MEQKRVIVLSLGGSLIIPERGPNIKFLKEFKLLLKRHYNKYRFVIVCGGGSIARKYISVLKAEGKSTEEQSQAGIRATRMNALLLMQLFGKEANDSLSLNMQEVKDNLHKNKVVICGALRYADHSTSDATSAKLASFLHAPFINMTNVPGLYTKDPIKYKDAKFIPNITWKNFEKMALKIKYHAGQHFILDQEASKLIKKHKTKTYIIGSLKDLNNILKDRKFKGTLINS